MPTEEVPETTIGTEGVAAALHHAAAQGFFPQVDAAADLDSATASSLGSLLRKPVALMYDLDVWDGMLDRLASSFGPGCMHALAVKGTAVGALLKRAVDRGFGLECASIGEVVHAEALGCPCDRIVFDSPAKTRGELAYSLRQGFHINVDNFEELARLAQIRAELEKKEALPKDGVVGLRINPLCGAGKIAALSVSVADSKFAVPVSMDTELLAAFEAHPWLTCLHIHVGSGGMGTGTLVEGVKIASEFCQRINKHLGKRQVKVLDIGGGLHPDYTTDKLPPFPEYAERLRCEVPGLLAGSGGHPLFDRVVTEFGQSLSAKTGFIATRLEYVKQVQGGSSQIAVGHMGADMCPRQCYTKDHKRRIEFFDRESCAPLKRCRTSEKDELRTTHLAGPLCFQGDFPARDLQAPELKAGDFAVLREGGSNTLALFSRHCSRMAPAVLGYKIQREGQHDPKVASMEVLKQPENAEQLLGFWGTSVPTDLQAKLAAST